jgi:hypothetical protein
MDMRDRARTDLYLAQLRTQSAPNTPGLKSPGLYSNYALSPRFPPTTYKSLGDIEESPFTPGVQAAEPQSAFGGQQNAGGFKLQAPPTKAPSATPKLGSGGFTESPRAPTPPTQNTLGHGPVASDEPTYDAVPIPGAYAGQAIKSPPPHQTSFGR